MSFRSSIEDILRGCCRWAFPGAIGGVLLLAACSSAPERPAPQNAEPVATSQPAGTPGGAVPPTEPGANAAVPPPPPPPPPRAIADFERAVTMMRGGNTTEAELEFQQISVAYPQFAGADINLGILYRKTSRLEQSEQALRAAVQRDSANAVAWNELGVTLRMRGAFQDAADAYQHAIEADANFAPAYRNLGVLLDLYIGDAPGALAALEHYKELTGEEKPVTGWIAELRQRTGKKAPPPAASPSGEPPPAASPPGQPPPAAAPPGQPQQTPREGTAPAPPEAPAQTPDKAGG
jgi:Flp pilus assembly protein TadD